MNDVGHYKRPIAASGLVFIVLNLAVLKKPDKFVYICVFAAVFALLCVVSLCKRRENTVFCVFLCAAALLGTVVPYFSYNIKEKNALDFVKEYGGAEHEFCGKVLSFSGNNSYSSFDVTLLSADGKDISGKLKADIYCYSADFADEGDIIVFSGTPKSVYDIDNDVFDSTSYMRSKHIFIQIPNVKIKSAEKSADKDVFRKIRNYINEIYYNSLTKKFGYDVPETASALITGERSGLDPDIKKDFRRSGLSHVLCISGMHLAIILGLFAGIFKRLTVHKNIGIFLLFCICVFYILLTGVQISVLRAGIMAMCSYSAMLENKKSDGINALFLAAAIICVCDPYAVLGVGTQLSFVSTFGIIVCSELFAHKSGFSYAVLSALAANAAAVAFSFPITALSFGEISVWSFVSSLAVSPLCECALTALVLLALLNPLSSLHVFSALYGFAADICIFFVRAMLDSAHFFAGFKYSLAAFPFCKALLYIPILCLAICALAAAFSDMRTVKRIFAFQIFFCIVMSAASFAYSVISDGNTEVWYYRKNASDTQISVKLARSAAVIFNADSNLCTDPDDAHFDAYGGNNYIFVIPSENTDAKILSHNIQSFAERFGVKGVYVAEFSGAHKLSDRLSEYGTNVSGVCRGLFAGNVKVQCTQKADGGYIIDVLDGNKKFRAVISEGYDANDVAGTYYSAAYFCYDSSNAFDAQNDTVPDSGTFFTRLKKGAEPNTGVQNTYGKKSVRLY